MSALLNLTRSGTTTLLWGTPGAYQSLVAEEIAFRAARSGRRVTMLVDGPAASQHLLDRIVAWRAWHKVEVGERMRIDTVDERQIKGCDLGAALLEKIGGTLETAPHDLVLRPHTIILCSPALGVQAIDGSVGQRVLEAARLFALHGCAVVVACHVGQAPGATCPSYANVDLWRCEARRSLGVELTGPKGQCVELAGREIGNGALSFEEMGPVV